jgi:glycerate dehydrogenase
MYHATLLDGYTIHKDDLNWFELKKLVSLTVYDRSAEDEVIDKAKKADIVLTNKVPITQTTIANLPKLKYIVSLATGTDHIDLAACKYYNIGVSNLKDYATHSVAQLVLSFIFDWLYRLDHYRKDMQKYEWTKCLDFSYEIAPIEELRNQ